MSTARPQAWWDRIVHEHRMGEIRADREHNMGTWHALFEARGYERGLEEAHRGALVGHLICGVSGLMVGVWVGWLL